MATIEDSFEKGERVDPGRMYAFMDASNDNKNKRI